MYEKPFGEPGIKVRSMAVDKICEMYQQKCGYDAGRHFKSLTRIDLYECTATGMRYWRPYWIAGDEKFYQEISSLYPHYYYRTDRWEYPHARKALSRKKAKVLEVGCGKGYFLRSLESTQHHGVGIELNKDAVANKVTKFPIYSQSLESYAEIYHEEFTAFCSFQVLEHVVDPAAFIKDAMTLLQPGGLLILSTPNYEFPLHKNAGDAFDLPPHHINHFTKSVFRKIADLFRLKLVSVKIQKEIHYHDSVGHAETHVGFEGAIRNVLKKCVNLFDKRMTLGHTIMVVLQKSA